MTLRQTNHIKLHYWDIFGAQWYTKKYTIALPTYSVFSYNSSNIISELNLNARLLNYGCCFGIWLLWACKAWDDCTHLGHLEFAHLQTCHPHTTCTHRRTPLRVSHENPYKWTTRHETNSRTFSAWRYSPYNITHNATNGLLSACFSTILMLLGSQEVFSLKRQ